MSEATDRCPLLARPSSRSQSSCSNRIALAIEAIPDTIGYVSIHVQKANAGRKYRAHLTGGAEQAEAIAQVDGACRVVGRLMIERHEMRRSFPGKFRSAPSAQLTELRVAERLECTCTIQPAINLPGPVDAAHYWDPACPVHLTDPNDG